MIYSGNAMYKLLKTDTERGIRLYSDPFKDKHSKGETFPYWKGTVVGIDIALEKREEFSILLSYIRDTYFKTVKERRKAKYKRAKFL